MFNDRSTPLSLLATRRSGKARDMAEPGPTPGQLERLLTVAARVPDHGKLAPWRFVTVASDRREALADRSGMICSGEQDVLLWPLVPADLANVAAIENTLKMNTGGYLTLSPAAGLKVDFTAAPAALGEAEADFYAYQLGPTWHYRERLGFRDHLTIVGAGHVSLALSRVVAALDFELTVLDDRPDLPTLTANDAAHHRRVIAYESVAAEIPAGPHQYVVVMTVGYRTDAVVLRHLLASARQGRSYRYLGVMGSVVKVAELRRGLQDTGFSTEAIAQLRGPIGVPINSQTPEEIAISIAAELIQTRHLL